MLHTCINLYKSSMFKATYDTTIRIAKNIFEKLKINFCHQLVENTLDKREKQYTKETRKK